MEETPSNASGVHMSEEVKSPCGSKVPMWRAVQLPCDGDGTPWIDKAVEDTEELMGKTGWIEHASIDEFGFLMRHGFTAFITFIVTMMVSRNFHRIAAAVFNAFIATDEDYRELFGGPPTNVAPGYAEFSRTGLTRMIDIATEYLPTPSTRKNPDRLLKRERTPEEVKRVVEAVRDFEVALLNEFLAKVMIIKTESGIPWPWGVELYKYILKKRSTELEDMKRKLWLAFIGKGGTPVG
jgi:hypothetical protein